MKQGIVVNYKKGNEKYRIKIFLTGEFIEANFAILFILEAGTGGFVSLNLCNSLLNSSSPFQSVIFFFLLII